MVATSPAARRPPPAVTIVGIGDDGPAGLGQRAREALGRAELLAGGKRHLAHFAAHPAEKLPITNNVSTVLDQIARTADERRCVLLASGDPCFFGIGPLLAERLGRERVEILPQPSSVALAFARLGLAWHDATVLSAHGRPLASVLKATRAASKLAILTDETNTPGVIAAALLAEGRPDSPACVLEHLGGPAERVVETTLAALPGQDFARLNVLVVLPDAAGRDGEWESGRVGDELAPTPPLSVFGRPEADFRHLRGQITKAEVRAVALAKLRLPPDGVLWDVGAGAGSLAIEAAGQMPRGRVFAIERDAEQVACLRQNVAYHGAATVAPVLGAAPAALGGLPKPDRVFVGGGGADLAAILEACLVRLAGVEGARLVVNAATLESVGEAERCCHAAGWETELVQVAVARGRAIGGRTRLESLNPVFILSAWREAEHGG